MKQIRTGCFLVVVLFFLALIVRAQDQSSGLSEMRDYIAQYRADVGGLTRKYAIRESDEYYSRFSQFYIDWLQKLKGLPFDAMSQSGKVDYVLLRNVIERDAYNLKQGKNEFEAIKSTIKFAGKITPLIEQRRRGTLLNPEQTAGTFNELKKNVKANQKEIEKLPKFSESLSTRAVSAVVGYRTAVNEMFKFYKDYDPQFTWWVSAPQVELDSAFSQYVKFLKTWKTVDASRDDGSGIVGNPIGREEIIKSLESEFISYTPEELVDIANKEFAWCEREMLKASAEMGFGDKWKDALEKVKNDHVEAGKQPELIEFLSEEAID